jgi:hypothetical protein
VGTVTGVDLDAGATLSYALMDNAGADASRSIQRQVKSRLPMALYSISQALPGTTYSRAV